MVSWLFKVFFCSSFSGTSFFVAFFPARDDDLDDECLSPRPPSFDRRLFFRVDEEEDRLTLSSLSYDDDDDDD